jgi:hypothetical protein
LLEISAGEHLKEDQRRLTEAGSTKIKSKFLLHDVLRKNQYGAVYLYQQKEKITYLSLKKAQPPTLKQATYSLHCNTKI